MWVLKICRQSDSSPATKEMNQKPKGWHSIRRNRKKEMRVKPTFWVFRWVSRLPISACFPFSIRLLVELDVVQLLKLRRESRRERGERMGHMLQTLQCFPSPPSRPFPFYSTSAITRIHVYGAKKITSSVDHHNHQAIRYCRELSAGMDPGSSGGQVSTSGLCRASQAVDLFPQVSCEIVVRDAHLKDCWEVAETHCSSFFPDYIFPLDLMLRIDRFVALLTGYSVPPGCKRACLVAITGSDAGGSFCLGSEDFRIGDFEGKFSFSRGSVAGILTVDTVADFLPRKGPLLQRRTGIAYLSNVAVREAQRRKGIAKKLVINAEARARAWGCRAMALHCDTSNFAAANLYKNLGFRSIKVPVQAKWPQPNASPDTQFTFMMKLLTYNSSQNR